MKKIILTIFIFRTTSSFAQNLVPNPSFEEPKDVILFGINAISNYLSEKKMKERNVVSNFIYIDHWRGLEPNKTPGILWANDSVRNYNYAALKNTPREPRTGSRCVLFMMISSRGSDWPPKEDNAYDNYLVVKLKKPLEKGKKYYLSFWIKPIREGRYATNYFYSCNNVGAYFSDTIIDFRILRRMEYPYKPDINQDKVITDTLNWTKIGGKFIAKSNAQYLTIGTFFPHQNTIFLNLRTKKHREDYLLSPDCNFVLDDVYVGEKPESKRKEDDE